MTSTPTGKVVTQKTLALYDKYDQDFELLYERWADECDRASITDEEAMILGKYVDHLHYLKGQSLSDELRSRFTKVIKELEPKIEDEVVETLKKRIEEKKA